MKKEDFKKITKEHVEFCEEIIMNVGACYNECERCPFHGNNSKNNLNCVLNNYATGAMYTSQRDEKLVKSCEEFLDLATDYFHEQNKKKRGKFSFKKKIKKKPYNIEDKKHLNIGCVIQCLDVDETCKYFEKDEFKRCKYKISLRQCN